MGRFVRISNGKRTWVWRSTLVPVLAPENRPIINAREIPGENSPSVHLLRSAPDLIWRNLASHF
jgi:hypothetical protein